MVQRSQAQGPLESGEARERARSQVCARRREWPRGHLAGVAAEEDQDKTVGGGEATEVKSQGREKGDGSGHYNDQE